MSKKSASSGSWLVIKRRADLRKTQAVLGEWLDALAALDKLIHRCNPLLLDDLKALRRDYVSEIRWYREDERDIKRALLKEAK